MTAGGTGGGTDRSPGRRPAGRPGGFRLAHAFGGAGRTGFRLRRPGTWPRWFWYLLFVVWSFLTAVGVTLLSVALYDSEPLPTFAGALAISLIFEAAWLTWGEYQRRRSNS